VVTPVADVSISLFHEKVEVTIRLMIR